MTDVVDRAKRYLLDSDMEEARLRRAQGDLVSRAKAFLDRPPDEVYAAILNEPDEPSRIKQAANAFLRAVVQSVADIPNAAGLLTDFLGEIVSGEDVAARRRVSQVESLRSMARRYEAARSGLPVPKPEFEALRDDEASLAGLGRAIERWGKETFPDDERLRDEWIATKIPGALGSMVSFLVGGAASSLAKLGGRAGAMVVGVSSGAMGQRRDAELHGATPQEKRIATLGGGAIGALDAVLPGRLLGESGLAGTVGKAALRGAKTEMIQENIQGIGQEALARVYDPHRSVKQSALNIAEQVALGGIVGGGAGAAFGVRPSSSSTPVQQPPPPAPIATPVQQPPAPPSATPVQQPPPPPGESLSEILVTDVQKAVPGVGKRYAKRPDIIGGTETQAPPLLADEQAKFPEAEKAQQQAEKGIRSQFPEAEKALQQAEKGIQPPVRHVKDWTIEKWHAASRLFPKLDTENQNDALTHVALREFLNAPSWATATAAEQTLRVTESLGRKQRSLFQRILALRDHIREADAERKTLPLPGYPDLDAMRSDLARWESLAQATPAVKTALKDRARMNRALVRKMIDLGLEGVSEATLKNVDEHVHRQVLKYYNLKKSFGLGLFMDNLHTPRLAGFQRRRKTKADEGEKYESPFNLNYEQSEFEWKAHALFRIAVKEAQDKIKAVNDIRPSLEQEAAAIKADTGKDVSWEELIPEGYVLWRPEKWSANRGASTIEEEVADHILWGEEGLIAREPAAPWVIPEHVAQTLDSLPQPKKEGFLLRLHTKAYSAMKKMQLASPSRILRYLVTNQISDASAAFTADPEIFKHWKHAASLMARVNTGEAIPAEMEYYQSLLKRDVVGSTITAHEIQDIDYQDLYDAARGTRFLRHPIGWYFEKVGKLMTTAEGVARLAAYERALELIRRGRRPLWASKASVMRALYESGAPREDIAAQLSRDLFIDYRGLPGWVGDVSRHAIPYARWLFGNMPRYARLITNAVRTGDVRTGIKGGLLATTSLGARSASLGARLAALHVATHIWNALMYPDEYEELRQGQRSIGIIVGKKNADGYIPSIRISDGAKEILEFVGLSDAPQDVSDVMSGRATLSDKAMETVRAPLEKLWFSAIPIERSVMETVVGRRTQYPHLFQKGAKTDIKTMPVRDRAEELLRPFALEWVYKKATGKPIPEHERFVPSGMRIAYWTDPGEAAYYAIRDRAYSWLQDRGISPPTVEPTSAKAKEKSDALYYWKKAVQIGDEAARKRWLAAYFMAGGSMEGLKKTLSRVHPLDVIPAPYRSAFVKSLTEQEKETLRLAAEWSVRRKRGS